MSTTKSFMKKKSTSLPAETVDYLKAWMMSPEHIAHPYPTDSEKAQIMADTGIELKQLTNWFVNNRKRYWKPRVEARLQQQQQQGQLPLAITTSDASSGVSTPVKRRGSNAVVSPMNVVDRLSAPSRTVSMTSLSSKHQDRASRGYDSSQILVSDASSASSVASDSASVFSSGAEDDMVFDSSANTIILEDSEPVDGHVSRTESVNVHILQPFNGTPTIADVSILSTVPKQRILFTYENCDFTYSFPADSIQDRKKVQCRRDSAVMRMKKHYLKLYLEETSAATTFRENSSTNKRSPFTCDAEQTPRKRFRYVNPTLWKEVCESAADLYDHDLPTLEEAALLFGFSRGISA